MLIRGLVSLTIALAFLSPTFVLTQTNRRKQASFSRPGRTFRSSPENARLLIDAYRVALAKPAVRTIARDEIRRQLRTNRPMLFVEGYWIVPIDMSTIYRNPSVRGALKNSIATGNGKPGRLTKDLSNLGLSTKLTTDIGLTTTESALGLAILPMRRSPVLNMNAELDKFLASMGIGKDAFEQSITDFIGIDDAILIGLGILTVGLVGYVWTESAKPPPDPWTPDGDADGDGKINREDDDDDNDGFKDKDDRWPLGPTAHICDCGNLGGPTRIVGLTTTSSVELATSVIDMMNTAKLESVRANTIPLGFSASSNAANNAQIRAMVITGP